MREYKFRFWSEVTKTMSPTLDLQGIMATMVAISKTHEVDKLTSVMHMFHKPMQYTGMKDIHGREIYENDICKQKIYDREVIGVMIYKVESLAFGIAADVNFNAPPNMTVDLHNRAENLPEVIGNIYENPELLPK